MLEMLEYVTGDWERKVHDGACVWKNEGHQLMQVGYLLDNEEFVQGRAAYALNQSMIWGKMRALLVAKWSPALEKLTVAGMGGISLADEEWTFEWSLRVPFCRFMDQEAPTMVAFEGVWKIIGRLSYESIGNTKSKGTAMGQRIAPGETGFVKQRWVTTTPSGKRGSFS
ncbi:hypothetical protein GYMLUDRAFT_260075 [Collybiopsis luxurians FD-317 M1]|uniref:Uncharacterized protein n=1 Tax=Collybiopsis luxurians FD-317 M1 TaxID=944289 RepID=A0A0D0C3W5_9AGAR|nr:hypothetical protein GYMLUDRAFT_260075 [Collybiopsis luxurians FD-317 M1]